MDSSDGEFDLDDVEIEVQQPEQFEGDMNVRPVQEAETTPVEGFNETIQHPGKPRLVIQKLVLENFKSYAGVQEIGPFHKSFTAVVGPNGSGKSNVLDALLFAFGKRASKIRLNKTSELIHNSDDHRDCEFAKVTVFFQEIKDVEGEEGFEPIEGTQFSITRAAYRDNQSKYFIGDRASSFTEVTNMLLEKNIDLKNNRFLILQGEVEQISMMKPKSQTKHEIGFLEYLEDIIGTNKYVEMIEKVEAELELCNERRVEKVNRFRIAEKEKNTLSEDKTEAEEYFTKDLERQKFQTILFQKELLSSMKEREEFAKKLSQVEEKHLQVTEELESVRNEVRDRETQYQSGKEESNALLNQVASFQEEFAELDRQYIQEHENTKHAKKMLKSKKVMQGQTEKAIETLEETKIRNSKRLPEIQKELKQLQKEHEKLETKKAKIFDQVQSSTGPLRAKLEKKQTELIPYRKTINERRGEVESQKSELEILESRSKNARLAFEKAQADLDQIKSKLKEIKPQKRTLEDDIVSHQSAFKSVSSKLSELNKNLTETFDNLQCKRVTYAQSKDQVDTQKSRGAVLNALLNAKSQSLPGIYGRLGDLGTIHKKYDVAVSTAFGALNFIVVDTSSTAQKCVELLRTQKLGTATFIILEKISYLDPLMKKTFSAPPNSQRCFDLINCQDETIRVAFYFAMKNTLVCSDLDMASKIAFSGQRFRVVTVKGDLIDTSGTMSGGGTQVSRGKMRLDGSKSSASQDIPTEDLSGIENDIHELEAAVNSMKQEKSLLEKESKLLKEDLKSKETQISKLTLQFDSLDSQHKNLGAQINSLGDQVNQTSAETNQIEKIYKLLSVSEKKLSQAEEAAEGLESQVEALEEEIMVAGGSKLRKVTEEIEGVVAQMSALESEETKLTVEIEGADDKIKENVQLIEELGKEIAKLSEDLGHSKASLVEIARKAKEVEDKRTELQDIVKSTVENCEELYRGFQLLKVKSNKMELEQLQVFNTIETLKQSVKEKDGTISSIERKLVEMIKTIREQEKDLFELLRDDEGEEYVEFQLLEEEQLKDIKRGDIEYQITMFEEVLENLNPDMNSIQEWKVKQKDCQSKLLELEEITKERDSIRENFDTLRQKRLNEFMAGFNVISMKLKEMYQMLTLGGDAELELVDSLDPFAGGIIFSVRPPKKSWKNISNLSGGEKTLSSLALVFSLHHYKPTPLYVMDEIDAALDFKNVSIVANYIKERTRNAQFIIISLRNNMFELGDRLVGIYKTHNASQSIAINPSRFHVAAQTI